MSEVESAKPDARALLRALHDDPALRAELAAALARGATRRQRIASFVAGASSAAVVMLAFLLPSIQDQWDRLQIRRAVDRYAEVGRELLASAQYSAAEQAFDHALELAGTQRTDLLEWKLRARVQRVNEDPNWHGDVPEELSEADFLYLLQRQQGARAATERVETLTAYGVLLAGKKRPVDAENRLREALAIDPKAAAAHVALGNLYDDLRRHGEAEAQYREAIAASPQDSNAYYDLGLLLLELGRAREAVDAFTSYVRLAPDEPLGHVQRALAQHAAGDERGARESYARALELEPANAQARQGLAELGGGAPAR